MAGGGSSQSMVLTPRYGYANDEHVYFPDVEPGMATIRLFVGDADTLALDSQGLPVNYWDTVDVVFEVDDRPYAFSFSDHRQLRLNESIEVLVARFGSTTEVETVDVLIDVGDGELTSLLAVFGQGEAVATVGLTPYDLGPLRLIGFTGSGEAFMSMTALVMLGDEFPGVAVGLPPNSGQNFSCDFTGGAHTPANPKIFCGSCAWTGAPVPPAQCGGAPAGQKFVQNGECSRNWLFPSSTCCNWSLAVVNSNTFVLTAGAAPVSCGITIVIGVRAVGLGITPTKICCTWNSNPAVPPAPANYYKCTTKIYTPGC